MKDNNYAGFIYITTNKITGTKYIGQHTKFNDKYLGSGHLLCKAIDKYGRENFERKIIDYAKTKEELNELEMFYIKKYNAVESPDFYNIAEGGHVVNYWNGKERDPETKKRISESQKGGKSHWAVPIVVFKDGKFFKEFECVKDFATYLENSGYSKCAYHGCKQMISKGWKPNRGNLKGWSAMLKEEYKKVQVEA